MYFRAYPGIYGYFQAFPGIYRHFQAFPGPLLAPLVNTDEFEIDYFGEKSKKKSKIDFSESAFCGYVETFLGHFGAFLGIFGHFGHFGQFLAITSR